MVARHFGYHHLSRASLAAKSPDSLARSNSAPRREMATFADRFRNETAPRFAAAAREALARDWAALRPDDLEYAVHDWTRRTLVDFARDSLKPTVFAEAAWQELLDVLKPYEEDNARSYVANLAQAEEKSEEKEKKPMSIHDVMEKGFKGGKSLLRTVTDNKKESTKEDNEKFLAMLKDMAKQKPPKGDEESWKKLTGIMIEPAEKIVKGEDVDKSKLELKKAANCAKCHKEHKASKDE